MRYGSKKPKDNPAEEAAEQKSPGMSNLNPGAGGPKPDRFAALRMAARNVRPMEKGAMTPVVRIARKKAAEKFARMG